MICKIKNGPLKFILVSVPLRKYLFLDYHCPWPILLQLRFSFVGLRTGVLRGRINDSGCLIFYCYAPLLTFSSPYKNFTVLFISLDGLPEPFRKRDVIFYYKWDSELPTPFQVVTPFVLSRKVVLLSYLLPCFVLTRTGQVVTVYLATSHFYTPLLRRVHPVSGRPFSKTSPQYISLNTESFS